MTKYTYDIIEAIISRYNTLHTQGMEEEEIIEDILDYLNIDRREEDE